MGKMKEIWAEMLQNEYRGDYDAYIQDLARQASLHQNESDITCDVCAQHFVQVDNALRFK